MIGGTVIRTFFIIFFIIISIFPLYSEYPEYLALEEKLWLTEHEGQVRLAPDSSFEPFEFFDSNNKYRGLSADYVHLIEKKLGFEFDYIKTPSWAVNVEKMKRKELDVWGAVVKTPQRDKFMEFTQPYYEIHSVLIIPSSYPGAYICDPDSRDRIAVLEGYYTHDYLLNNYRKENIFPFSSPMDALKSVQSGQTAAFLTDIATASYYFEKTGIINLRVGGSPDLGSSFLSIAVRDDWKILADIIDKVIERITPEEHAEIIRKWVGIQNSGGVFSKLSSFIIRIGVSLLIFVLIMGYMFHIYKNKRQRKYIRIKVILSFLIIIIIIVINISLYFSGLALKFQLTEEEQSWLDNNNGLKIAPDYSFAPIEFIKDNKYEGIAADYVEILENMLDYKFEIVQIEKWNKNVEFAKNREIDIWSAVAPTPQKSEYMLFTDPYLNILSVLVVSKGDDREYNLENMDNKVVAVVDGYFTHDYLRKNYPDIQLQLVENAEKGLRSVVFENADAILIDIASASWLIEKNGLTTLKVVKSIDTEYQLSFASRSDMPILNQILNRALDSIDQDSRSRIYQKWISYSAPNYMNIKKVLLISVIPVVFIFIVFVIIIIWNRSLRKMVSLRVEQLAEKDAQLFQAQKMEMVGTLAGGLAHDFNNIVTGISGTVSLIKLLLDSDGFIETDQLKEYLALIDKSGERASQLVQQLLTVSNEQKPNMSIINLNDLVLHVTSIVKITLDNSIEMDIKYSDKEALINADSGQIEQILLNFCVNASHAMTIMRVSRSDWGGSLSISVQHISPKKRHIYSSDDDNTNYWVVTVKDTGIGMSEDVMNNIFTPFFTTKDIGDGTGMGLSMVYSIANLHDGFIDVSSVPGFGSEFQLYIPEKKS